MPSPGSTTGLTWTWLALTILVHTWSPPPSPPRWVLPTSHPRISGPYVIPSDPEVRTPGARDRNVDPFLSATLYTPRDTHRQTPRGNLLTLLGTQSPIPVPPPRVKGHTPLTQTESHPQTVTETQTVPRPPRRPRHTPHTEVASPPLPRTTRRIPPVYTHIHTTPHTSFRYLDGT